tara:strand:- start:241 stop:753 length:513 start_codon:yes stop_codon:yes gene_type:complete
MVRKVKRSDLDDLDKQKKETQNYGIIGSDSFDNVQQFIGKNKKIVYGLTGLIIVLCIIFLLMPSKGEVYFSESECTTGMKVTYEGTDVKFETDYRDFGDVWGSGNMYFDDGGFFYLYDENDNIIDSGNFRERAGPNYEYQSGILEIEVSESPTSVGIICHPTYEQQVKTF